jgi:hypothetical protein
MITKAAVWMIQMIKMRTIGRFRKGVFGFFMIFNNIIQDYDMLSS